MNPALRKNFTPAGWLSEIEEMSWEASLRYLAEDAGGEGPGLEPSPADVDAFYTKMAKHYRRKFKAPRGVSLRATVAALKRGSLRALRQSYGEV